MAHSSTRNGVGALDGKGAVITGGGRGIGAAVAWRLAADGAAVVVSARSVEEIEAVAEEMRAAGFRAAAVACDVTDPEQIDGLLKAATEELGTVDLLVNNAGVASSGPLKAITLEEWNRLFAVNATGTFLCTQAFLPSMLKSGWGRVVNISSVAGKMGAPYIAAYAASKHAVIGLTRSVAAEVAARGVTVNAVCPGYVATEMSVATVDRIIDKTGLDAAAARRSLEDMSPQGRIYEAEEVAHLVSSLCHPLAGGVNGQALVLDGGALQS
jgi:NAD(P)-dependent dehydrogenase (short-subunit alcohol dehydrogenase family)